MMELVCTLLFVGRLCVVSPNGGGVSADVWQNVQTSGAAITGEWWKAGVLWESDYARTLNPSRLSRACAGDRCISYFLHCEDAICSVVVGSGQNSSLDINLTAASISDAREALKRFHFLIDASDVRSAVWFGDFKESTRFEDPYCNRRGRTPEGKIIWDEGCEFLAN